VGQLRDGVSRKWGRSVAGSARSGAVVLGVQQEVGQECEVVSRKWGRSVRGLAGSGARV